MQGTARITGIAIGSWKRPDRRAIYEWARDHVEMPPAVTIRGKFDVSKSRRLIAPFEALGCDLVREVNVLAPVRGGKTLLADVWVPWIITEDAGPTIWNFQKDQTADEHCETRLWPVLLACDPVRPYLEAVSRNKKRTSEIIMPHMFLVVQGPALSNLQSKGCRYLINDELWQYPPGRLAEAYGRVDDFLRMGISKILNLSQASEPDSEWHQKWEGSSRDAWWIECQKCGRHQYPAWSGQREDGSRYGMRWDEHRLLNKDWNLTRALPTIRWECAHCGHPHIDGARLKLEWNRTGRYERTNPDCRPSRIGFHWNALIDYPWVELADRFMRAADARRRGVLLPMIQFFQKQLAQFMNEAKLLETSASLPTASYDVMAEWPEEVARFLTVDRQAEDTYWAMVRAWSRDGQSRRLWFGLCHGSDEIEARRQEFNVQPNNVLVDSGHEAKGDFGVYAICGKHGWIATKGFGNFFTVYVSRGRQTVKTLRSYARPIKADPTRGAGKSGPGSCDFIKFCADEMKDRVTNLIKLGKWLEPAGGEPELEKEYAIQMAAEFKKEKRDKFTGRKRMVWACPSQNNHAFDCAALQALAATILKLLPDVELADEPSQSHD